MISNRSMMQLFAIVIIAETGVNVVLAWSGAWWATIAIIPSTAAASFSMGMFFAKRIRT